MPPLTVRRILSSFFKSLFSVVNFLNSSIIPVALKCKNRKRYPFRDTFSFIIRNYLFSGKIFSNTLLCFFHCFIAFVPVGRTNFPVFLKKLESIHHSQCFRNTPSERHVVYNLMSYYPFFVNQK